MSIPQNPRDNLKKMKGVLFTFEGHLAHAQREVSKHKELSISTENKLRELTYEREDLEGKVDLSESESSRLLALEVEMEKLSHVHAAAKHGVGYWINKPYTRDGTRMGVKAARKQISWALQRIDFIQSQIDLQEAESPLTHSPFQALAELGE